jgi:hypothetical protein
VSDPLDDKGSFISLEELQNNYKIKTNFLTYASLQNSIKTNLTTYRIEIENNMEFIYAVEDTQMMIHAKDKKRKIK